MDSFTIAAATTAGAALGVALWQSSARTWLKALGTAVLAIAALLALVISYEPHVAMGGSRPGLVGLVMYAGMISGMLSQAFLTGTGRRRSARRWLFPLLVSPIVFGTLWGQLQHELTVGTVVLSYQNGFFWKALYDATAAQMGGAREPTLVR
jgi:hypothetical protein